VIISYSFLNRNRAAGDPFGERLTFDQFHYQKMSAALLLQSIQRSNVFVIGDANSLASR
jgi:hypothetical protein